MKTDADDMDMDLDVTAVPEGGKPTKDLPHDKAMYSRVWGRATDIVVRKDPDKGSTPLGEINSASGSGSSPAGPYWASCHNYSGGNYPASSGGGSGNEWVAIWFKPDEGNRSWGYVPCNWVTRTNPANEEVGC